MNSIQKFLFNNYTNTWIYKGKGECVTVIFTFPSHAHKHTVMDVEWNKNGNWLLTASRDHLVKLFDIRKMKEEIQTFKGHKKEAMGMCWVTKCNFRKGIKVKEIVKYISKHDEWGIVLEQVVNTAVLTIFF